MAVAVPRETGLGGAGSASQTTAQSTAPGDVSQEQQHEQQAADPVLAATPIQLVDPRSFPKEALRESVLLATCMIDTPPEQRFDAITS